MPQPDIVGQAPPHPTGLISGGVDSSGIVTSILKFRVETEKDARDYMRGQSHPTLGIPEDSRSWEEMDGCLGFELTITYKGVSDEEGEDVELDASFSEEPIESHPNFLEIKKKYKGWINAEGEVEFPETIKLESSKGLKKGAEEDVKNPMFGVKTYLVLSAVVRRSFSSSKRPRLSMIGSIVKSVPGGFSTPENHDWMIMPPKSRRRGKDKYENTIEYLLSPLGGWTEGVYALMEGRWEPESDDDNGLGLSNDSRFFGQPVNPSNRNFGDPGTL